MMKNFSKMMKQAQEMQQKMAEVQEKIAQAEVEGQAGAGMVKLTLNGKGELKTLTLDPKIMDPEDTEMAEDLIKAAFQDAKAKADAFAQEEMGKVTGGLGLPGGMQLPF